MILKRTILIIVGLFIKIVVLSQQAHSIAKSNIKDSLRIDTLEIKVQKISFITNDTVFNVFISIDTLGTFHVFASQQRLEDYKQVVSGKVFYIHNEILGDGQYTSTFNSIEQVDTIYSYRNYKVEYYDRKKLRTDNLGIPILEYDIEHSYILKQMNQNISSQYIYCLINGGTKLFYAFHPSGYLKSSILLKVDTSQDTTYNFFRYKGQSESYKGMQFSETDSIILPLKKLRKSRIYNYMGALLTPKENSDIYSENYERTYVLILTGKRFVVSPNLYRKREDEWGWVSMVESISITLKQLQEKFFQ
jgi:hypothetical protein